MKVQFATSDSAIEIDTQKQLESDDSMLVHDVSMRPIISVKEARKLIGKALSDQLDDDYLTDVIRRLSYLSRVLLSTISVS